MDNPKRAHSKKLLNVKSENTYSGTIKEKRLIIFSLLALIVIAEDKTPKN